MEKRPFVYLFLALFFSSLISPTVQAQEFVWAYTAGGPGYQELALDAAVDDSGHVYMVGQYEAGAAFGTIYPPNGGLFDMFLAKFDIDGNLIWLETLSSSNTDKAYSLRIGPDKQIYIVGYSKIIFPGQAAPRHARDALLAKYAPDGSLIWGRPIDGDNFNETHDLEIDSAGNIYITGRFNEDSYFPGDTLWGNGNTDMFIAKYNPQGDLLWVNGYGGPANDESWGIAIDGAANSYIGGFYQDSCLFDSTWVYSAGGKDAFIAKHDSAGNLLWVKTFNGALDDEILSIKCTPEGRVYFGGNFQDSLFFGTDTLKAISFFDVFFARMDSSGSIDWAKLAGGSSFDGLEDIQIGPDEDIYLCGFFFSNLIFEDTITLTGSGGYDAWLARLDSTGTFKSSEVAVYQQTGSFLGLEIDRAENLYITGRYLDSIFFDTLFLASPTRTTDFFLTRYSPAREIWIDSTKGTPNCNNDSLHVYFDLRGAFNGNNTFYLELSDASGNFSNPDTLSQLAGYYGGSIHTRIPPGIPNGSGYRVRLSADSPQFQSPDNGYDISLQTQLSPSLSISGDTLLCDLPDTVTWSVPAVYAQILWSNGDTTPTAHYSTAGTHFVDVWDSSGCSDSDTFQISLCVQTDQAISRSVLVSPIPADQQLRVENIPQGATRLQLIDTQGRQVFAHSLKHSETSLHIPTADLPEGLYFMKIFLDQQTQTKKVLIIHSF